MKIEGSYDFDDTVDDHDDPGVWIDRANVGSQDAEDTDVDGSDDSHFHLVSLLSAILIFSV